MFVDEVRIFVRSGRGGDGVCSFRREKYVPRGGPDGGDGGNGGNVIVVASGRLTTLLDLRYQQHYEAKPGNPGEGSNRHGRTAPDVIIHVPVGTVITDEATGETLADLTADGQSRVVARGGRGGRGNANFATSTNRIPTRTEPGTPGEERWLHLELKLLADVGLVGFPNAGKSTLIAAISAARPKIADYPFTTLTPNLGVADLGQFRTLVVADIPGLIEGAHEGHGLGIKFLRHVERTSLLIHLVDPTENEGRDPFHDWQVINSELREYRAALEEKPQIVAVTKMDTHPDPERYRALEQECRR